MKNYLPSKKFTYSLLIIILVGVVIFTLSYFFGGKNKYFSSKETELSVGKLTLNQLIQKDSDDDQVMDWEEALWGTDPNKKATFDGVSDFEYIKNKRKELNIAEGATDDGEPLTETDKFSQEFFASFMAMKQNGQIDENTINNVSSALGQRIADPTLTDKYTENDVKLTKEDSVKNREMYYITIRKIFAENKKKGIGNEIELVGNLAVSEKEQVSPTDIEKLESISKAYIDFSQEVMKISVPKSVLDYHLKIVNSANNTGISVENMTKTNGDPIVGLSGLSQYKKYSEDLITSVSELETMLLKN